MTFRHFLGVVGDFALERVRRLRYLASVIVAVVRLAVRPKTWRRTVRDVHGRQIVYTGVEAVPFTSRVPSGFDAVCIMLVTVIVRELGPLLANVIVIGRSGNAMASELGHMKFSGEVRALDAQGLDPMVYLVVPRVVAMMLCVLCLTVVFIAVSFFSGYVFGLLLNVKTGGARGFLESVAGAIGPLDVFNVVAKSLIPGLLAGVICCVEGLSVGTTVTDLPQAITRAVQQSVVALFFTSSVISLITYL